MSDERVALDIQGLGKFAWKPTVAPPFPMVSTRLTFVEFKLNDVERAEEERRINTALATAIARRARFATIRLEGRREAYRARLTYNGDDSFNLSEFKPLRRRASRGWRRHIRRQKARA